MCFCQTSVLKDQSWSERLETLLPSFQFAKSVKGTGEYCPKTVFAAFGASQPSRALPVCLQKVSQYRNNFVACSKDLLQASDSSHVSILSLLDLSVAFDTTNYSIRITRLHPAFDCSGMVLSPI